MSRIEPSLPRHVTMLNVPHSADLSGKSSRNWAPRLSLRSSADRVIASEVVKPGHDLLVMGARGLGKRSKVSQYRLIGRGGKGVTAMKLTAKTGKIVAAGMVNSDHDVVIISSIGKVIRISAKQIPCIGRATQGVTLMRFDPEEEIVTMTIAEPREEGGDPTLIDLNASGEDASPNGSHRS